MYNLKNEAAADFYRKHYEALQRGDIPELELLSSYGAFPCGIDGWLGRHWLVTAIEGGNLTSIAWVLSKSPDVNFVDDTGNTAMKAALGEEKGYTIRTDARMTPEDATSAVIRIIDLLLQAGAEINQRVGLDETPLHCAASWNTIKVIQHLLDRGADPLAQDSDYGFQTPADVAKSMKRWDVHAHLRAAMGQDPSGRPMDAT